MDELSVRITEPQAGCGRRPLGDAAPAGRPRLAKSRSKNRLRSHCEVTPREHCRSLLLLAGFLLVAYAPFARILDHSKTLREIGCDHSTILAGAGVVLILAVLGEHLLIEYSRLARLTATGRRPQRSSGR